MGLEAATCAAVAVMDGLFESWAADDVWKSSVALGRQSEASTRTMFNRLYHSARLNSRRPDDPHGGIYTTPYAHIALGFYGGNQTVVFAPAEDGGSGVDLHWMAARDCPGPPRPEESSASSRQRWCENRERNRIIDDARTNEDSGETLTPGYKAPREVEGLLVHPWLDWRSQCEGFSRGQSELAPLTRPLSWAFYRVVGQQQLLVLAPGVVPGGVHGIDHFTSRSPQRFFATPRLPSEAPLPVAPGVPYEAMDRAVASKVEIPAWGVLYRCAKSNVLTRLGSVGLSAHEMARRCMAVDSLRPHVQRITPSLFGAVRDARLPANLAADLAAMRVWPADAWIDLAVSSTVSTQSQSASHASDAVCLLTVADMLRDPDLRLRCVGHT